MAQESILEGPFSPWCSGSSHTSVVCQRPVSSASILVFDRKANTPPDSIEAAHVASHRNEALGDTRSIV